jgi:hypothetical protein
MAIQKNLFNDAWSLNIAGCARKVAGNGCDAGVHL